MDHFNLFYRLIIFNINLNLIYVYIICAKYIIMSTTVYQYRVYCTTDSKYVTTWNTTTPTTCPENNSHSINSSLTTVVNEITETEVKIKEEDTPTGGHFKLDMLKIVAPRNAVTTKIFKFDYPINIVTTRLITGNVHEGDVLCWSVAPNTTVGALTASYTASATWSAQNYVVNDLVWYQSSDIHYGSVYKCIVDTVSNEEPTNTTYWQKQFITFNVSSTVTSYVKIGFLINLFNGSSSRNIGYVTAVDQANGTITVNGSSDINFSAASPTYVRMTIMFMDHVELGPAMNYPVGGDKIGSSYVPSGTKISASYDNKSADTDKTLICYVEYLY